MANYDYAGYGQYMNDNNGTTGLYDNLIKQLEVADLGDYGDILGGVGSFATGLFEMYQGNKLMDEYKKINDANIQNMRRKNYAETQAYNNQLARGASARRGVSGGTDPLKNIDETKYQV